MLTTRREFLKTATAAGIAVGGTLLFGGCGSSDSGSQTTLFNNGTFYLDPVTKASNLLVRDGVVIGYDVSPADWGGALQVDLAGGYVYPGFTDSHMHLMETGTMGVVGGRIDPEPKTGDQVVEGLKLIDKQHPGANALLGFGLHPDDYDAWSLADLQAIDNFAPNRVVIVFDRLGHNCVVNSYAMQKFMIDQKPVPYGGTVVRQNGKATGMFRESAMNMVATDAFAEFKDSDVKLGTMLLACKWAAKGYTGVVDLMGATGIQLMRPRIFRELESEGKLPLRIHYCYTLLSLDDVDKAATYLGQDTDLVRFVGGKIFVDGAFAGGQAWTSWPHIMPAGNFGLPQITTDDTKAPELNINRIVARAEELGLNMHYHVQGDLAIKAVLDALSQVLDATGKLQGIHTLIHLAYPTDSLVDTLLAINARAGGAHVVTTMQPGFWDVEEDTVQYYGDQALAAYPLKMLIDRGVSVGISTDYAVSPDEYSSPTAIMSVATTGGKNAEHHQPISIRDMVTGLTVGSVRTTGQREFGMLHVGYKADMVVYAQDLYQTAPKDFSLGNPAVVSTWINGKKIVNPV